MSAKKLNESQPAENFRPRSVARCVGHARLKVLGGFVSGIVEEPRIDTRRRLDSLLG